MFAICTGTMISSGLFVLPGLVAAQVGDAVVLVYLFSGLLLVPSMLSISELATAMPRAGGTYFFISRSLGSMFGTVSGIGDWLALLLKTSIALIGLGAYLSGHLGIPVQLIALFFCLFFVVLNLVGAKETSGLQLAMVAILLGILAHFIGTGFQSAQLPNVRAVLSIDAGSFLPATAMVFISYIGLTKVASVAEEIKSPERNIPLGMLLSLGVVLVFYGLIIVVVSGTVPAEQFYQSLTPVSDAAFIFGGRTGVILVGFAAVMAFATTANAGILSASRYLLAMSRDRVLPHPLSHFSRFRTPGNAIALTAVVIAVIVLTTGLEQIAKLASAFQLLVFAFVHIAVILMRESGIESYDPGFKSPFYPYIQIFGILVSIILIPEMGLISSIFALGVIGLGIVWFLFYVKSRQVRVGAVAQVAQRLAERLLQKDAAVMGLHQELRQILKEKGLRKDDPFDRLVRSALFIDVQSTASCEDILRLGANILADSSGISRDLVLGSMLERNRLGETPADVGVALPHVLLDEADGFYLVAVRSIHGVDFPMASGAIHAVFMLLGNRQDPRQHLRVLAEIARRAENPKFLDRWIEARSENELKELMIDEREGGEE